MPGETDKAKRWRPTFSIRTLVVVVTLVCAYAACWGPTKGRGIDDVHQYTLDHGAWEPIGYAPGPGYRQAAASAPLIVGIDDLHLDGSRERHYYLWFFGYVAKLPYEGELRL